jgi:hypothetical protein
MVLTVGDFWMFAYLFIASFHRPKMRTGSIPRSRLSSLTDQITSEYQPLYAAYAEQQESFTYMSACKQT